MVPAEDADDDDLDEQLDAQLGIGRRSRAARRRRAQASRDAPVSERPVRRWRRKDDDDTLDDLDEPRREKPPVFWRARDSLYFEPLVALAILAVLLVSLFAYTSNWPPVYVVESNSMQHGSGDHLGVLNAGDIVLAQKVGASSITTFVDALRSGFTTYGRLGDVILYYPNGSTSATPIIHRAILFFQYDSHSNTYNASGLAGLKCGESDSYVYYSEGSGGQPNCATTGLGLGTNLTLYNVGGKTINIEFTPYVEEHALGYHSGYLTLGDNNSYTDQISPTGGAGLSTLVEPGWVIGVARGLIPWFGAVKLLLDGNSGKVPTASWEFLGLTLAGIIFAAAGVHFLARRRREERHGKPDEAEAPFEEEEEARPKPKPAPTPARGRPAVQPWKAAQPTPAKEETAAPPTPRRMSYEQRRRSHFVTAREHRPAHARRKSDDDGDEADGAES